MPPRLHLCSNCLRSLPRSRVLPLQLHKYLSTLSAIVPEAPPFPPQDHAPPSTLYPPTQPPSHRPPELRKTQLHRQYTSLLRSTPLMLLFQHNNLTAPEWMAVRRELTIALRKTDAELATTTTTPLPLADSIKIQIIQTRVFQAALLIVEQFDPTLVPDGPSNFTHALSRTARAAVSLKKQPHPLSPLLSGPLAVVTFPEASPMHMKTALSILAPSAPVFAAPTRRANPGYHDAVAQSGLRKLLFLGARVEGMVFDVEGARGVGVIEGGLEGLRARIVGMLAGVGARVTGLLDAPGRSLYFTLEGRRGMLEDEAREPGADEGKEARGEAGKEVGKEEGKEPGANTSKE